jgi:hypothetical protein
MKKGKKPETTKSDYFIYALEEFQKSIQRAAYQNIEDCRANPDFQKCSLEDKQILIDIAYAYLSSEGYL